VPWSWGMLAVCVGQDQVLGHWGHDKPPSCVPKFFVSTQKGKKMIALTLVSFGNPHKQGRPGSQRGRCLMMKWDFASCSSD
jgi:hypothetical protein